MLKYPLEMTQGCEPYYSMELGHASVQAGDAAFVGSVIPIVSKLSDPLGNLMIVDNYEPALCTCYNLTWG
jgi:hypothetical protein